MSHPNSTGNLCTVSARDGFASNDSMRVFFALWLPAIRVGPPGTRWESVAENIRFRFRLDKFKAILYKFEHSSRFRASTCTLDTTRVQCAHLTNHLPIHQHISFYHNPQHTLDLELHLVQMNGMSIGSVIDDNPFLRLSECRVNAQMRTRSSGPIQHPRNTPAESQSKERQQQKCETFPMSWAKRDRK